MDPISQGVLGASCAQSISRRRNLAPATVAGALAGMAPDLDVLISSTTDPLLFLEYHRHFTHALAFIPVGALICAIAFHWFLRHQLKFSFTYLACLVGYASHGPLDACTTYGTLLFWPFSDTRVAWNNVSVVDPIFTVPVLVLGYYSFKRHSPILGRCALGWAIGYLLLGLSQTHSAQTAGAELAASRGHVPVRAQASPAIGNLWLWRHIYEYDGRIYADALRVGFNDRVFEGSSLSRLNMSEFARRLNQGSTQAKDVDRFAKFADGYLGIAEDDENRIIDLRYSPLPNEVSGIWSIVIDPSANDEAHVRFETDRGSEPGRVDLLFEMLFR